APVLGTENLGDLDAHASRVFVNTRGSLLEESRALPVALHLRARQQVVAWRAVPRTSPHPSIALISAFNTFPTFDRGRSSQTSICLGVLTLPMRVFTKACTSAGVTDWPGRSCSTAVRRSPH